MEFVISVDIPGLDVKEERDFSIMYGEFLSRSLFSICRKRSRATLNLDYYSVLSNSFCADHF